MCSGVLLTVVTLFMEPAVGIKVDHSLFCFHIITCRGTV